MMWHTPHLLHRAECRIFQTSHIGSHRPKHFNSFRRNMTHADRPVSEACATSASASVSVRTASQESAAAVPRTVPAPPTATNPSANPSSPCNPRCCFCLSADLSDMEVPTGTTRDAEETQHVDKQLFRMPCGTCKSWVHRHCLEKLLQQSYGPTPAAQREITIMTRPDSTLTVCTQCSVCQSVFEYRTQKATPEFKRVTGMERLARKSRQITTVVMPTSMALVYTLGYLLSHLRVVTRDQLVDFAEKLAEFAVKFGRTLGALEESCIRKWMSWVFVPALLVGTVLWTLAGGMFFLNTSHMFLAVLGVIPLQVTVNAATLTALCNSSQIDIDTMLLASGAL